MQGFILRLPKFRRLPVVPVRIGNETRRLPEDSAIARQGEVDKGSFLTRTEITLQAAGDWLQRRQELIRRVQWGFVLMYYFLLIAPALLPQPMNRAEIFSTLAGFAEIVFWGIWWPGVILCMLLFGQFWCGVFCPDGTLTEWVSRHGRGGKIPAWVRWRGWPLLAFSVVVVYEHLLNAHQAPRAMLVSLGGASLLALGCGYFFGRGKRVWCRYLCPVSSMFSLLARCAIFHFKVDRPTWDNAPKPLPRGIDCPPLLDVRRLRSNEKCSMCGRCSGHRNAVKLAARWPGREVVNMAPNEIRLFDAFAVCFVLIGLCYGALHGRSPGVVALLQSGMPGLAIKNAFLAAALGMTLIAAWLGSFSALLLLVAAQGRFRHALHLAYALIPLAGLGLFSGALEHSFALLAQAGFSVAEARSLVTGVCVASGGIWSFCIARQIIRNWSGRHYFAQGIFSILLAILGSAYFFVSAEILAL
ncbi:4Fe-4S binding domain-containing protein [Betaproteobacteria bacterium]|nr:4Fe-4S binding domain-containing protein [Betaproteobacteria bacterium]GHU40722.1 4Fe-4S binding domain-containing protein [Betaproteobacteria bacterium]